MASLSRRQLVRGAAAGAAFLGLPAIKTLSAGERWRPSEELRCAVIGIRGRGRSHIDGLRRQEGVRIVALCDADRDVLAREAGRFEERGESVDTYVDLRHVMDRDDIDIVATATPNHWHALISIWACQTGKDVYVEKPVSHNIWEGRKMVEAAAKYDRIVQTGTQSRSSHGIRDAVAWVRAGNLGRIEWAQGLCYKPRNSIGLVDGPGAPPASVDYDLWVGPAPMKPLGRRNLHYDWHWVFDTGNGDLGNQGIHQMDQCRWGLGESKLAPRVLSVGGRVGYEDDANTPNTQFVFLDYPDAPLVFEVRGLPKDKASQGGNWRGNMDKVDGVAIGAFLHCEGGTLKIPNYNSAIAYDADGQEIQRWNGSDDHFVNFIEAVRARDAGLLKSNIEEGHISSALCHQGNVSYHLGTQAGPEEVRSALTGSGLASATFERMVEHLARNEVDLDVEQLTSGRLLEFDPDTERFVGDVEANRLLARDYRAPFVVPAEV